MPQSIEMEKTLVKIIGVNGRFTHSCLALFYLREELSRHCPQLETRLCQFTINDNHFETVLRISEKEPRVILFSAAIWNSSFIERLLPDLHQILPESSFIIGGPQAEVVGENLMNKVPVTIVQGDIEALPPRFFTDLATGKLDNRYQGTLLHMEKPYFLFPYCDTDFTGPLANRHIYYESSKGCPYRCSYCLSSVETGVYHKPLDQVKDELRIILQHQPKIVRFIDRTFNDNPRRSLAIWQFLRKEGGDTLFHFEMAPDRFTEEIFLFLEDLPAGRFQFEIGIQSTHTKTLQAIRRYNNDMAKISRNISRLSVMGRIHLHLDLILGLPFDTMESFAQSFRDVFMMGGHYIQMGLLKVLPGTEISLRADEYGYVWTKEPPYSLLASRWLSHKELQWLYWFSEMVEKFLNNRYFSSLWRYLRRRDEDIFVFCKNLFILCNEENFFSFAATHELMGEKLVHFCAERKDFSLIVSLLRFDWLRCNHRFLPEFLRKDQPEEPRQTRDYLYRRLAEEFLPLYARGRKNHFFRKSFFLKISPETAEEIAGVSGDGTLLFLQEKEDNIHKYNRVVFLQETADGGILLRNISG